MTILNTVPYEKFTHYTWGLSWYGLALAFFIAAVTVMLFQIIKASKSSCGKIAINLFRIEAIALIFISFYCFAHRKPVYQTIPEYTVKLDNTVSFVEFYNKYEIIKQIDTDEFIVHLLDNGGES